MELVSASDAAAFGHFDPFLRIPVGDEFQGNRRTDQIFSLVQRIDTAVTLDQVALVGDAVFFEESHRLSGGQYLVDFAIFRR